MPYHILFRNKRGNSYSMQNRGTKRSIRSLSPSPESEPGSRSQTIQATSRLDSEEVDTATLGAGTNTMNLDASDAKSQSEQSSDTSSSPNTRRRLKTPHVESDGQGPDAPFVPNGTAGGGQSAQHGDQAVVAQSHQVQGRGFAGTVCLTHSGVLEGLSGFEVDWMAFSGGEARGCERFVGCEGGGRGEWEDGGKREGRGYGV